MTDDEKLKRLGLDKIAFLILLLVGLLIAKLIVSSRGNFKLSKPFAAAGCGVSASIPVGGGFQQHSTNGFEYNDNEFRLSSIMRISNDEALMVHWRYFIIPFKKSVAQRFEQQASDIEGDIEKTGQEKFGQLTFDYARIVSQKNSILFISATTLLPDGRSLSLEITQKGNDINLADKIFSSVAASAVFEPDNPLANGTKLLKNFKNKSLADFIKNKLQQNYYFIENFTGQTIGFITDAMSIQPVSGRDKGVDKKNSDSPRSEAGMLFAANLYLLQVGVNSFAEQSLLHGEPDLKTFKWVCLQNDLLINHQTTISIELNSKNQLTIRSDKNELDLTSTDSIIPDILTDAFIYTFVVSDFNSLMVDYLFSDGRLNPVLISKADKQQISDPNITFAVTTQFFGVDASRQINYLDKNGQILKTEVRGKLSYKLERTNENQIIARFPAWKGKIEQIGEILEESKIKK